MAGSTVWLVGMMGAGKSSVGRALARELGRPYVDSDAHIEAAAQATVAEIFERDGEAAFRALERQEIEACAGRSFVVALGGGAIAQPGMPERLAESGVVVYLRARPETLLARLGDCATRPLLRDRDPAQREERLRALLAERGPIYEEADLVIDTDDVGVGLLAQRLARLLDGMEAAC